MPRPMIKASQTQEETYANNLLSATFQESSNENKEINKKKLEQMLRKPRSKKYMEALHKLDSGGHVHNQNKVNEIISDLESEFPELKLKGILLGYVAICYLGKPYEVHTLDLTGEIIEHYKVGETLPNGLEKARGIALRGGYEFIEVYVDCCRAISSNGSVSVISD